MSFSWGFLGEWLTYSFMGLLFVAFIDSGPMGLLRFVDSCPSNIVVGLGPKERFQVNAAKICSLFYFLSKNSAKRPCFVEQNLSSNCSVASVVHRCICHEVRKFKICNKWRNHVNLFPKLYDYVSERFSILNTSICFLIVTAQKPLLPLLLNYINFRCFIIPLFLTRLLIFFSNQ